MVFADILSWIEGRRRTLVFYNVEDRSEEIDRIIEYVGAHDVDIEYASDAGMPESVVVRDGNETLSVDEIETVYEYIVSWESEMTSSDHPPSLFAALDETVFRSKNKRQLVLASRLIENRAATIGHGSLSVGFQQLSRARAQLPFYRSLPSTVTIALYGTADWTPPTDSGIEAYEPTLDEYDDYWWVIYNDDQSGHQAALVAEERDPGEYTGFWTYRQSIVEDLRVVVDSLAVRRLTDTE